jgi:hypothetical protein
VQGPESEKDQLLGKSPVTSREPPGEPLKTNKDDGNATQICRLQPGSRLRAEARLELVLRTGLEIMAKNENTSDTGKSAVRPKKTSKSKLHPLHEAAMRIADMGRNRSRTGTKDLVAMLLGHGARAWRSTQPTAKIHLHVTSPGRHHPVWLRLPNIDRDASL